MNCMNFDEIIRDGIAVVIRKRSLVDEAKVHEMRWRTIQTLTLLLRPTE